MTILYVEDDPDDCELFKEAVRTVSPRALCHVSNTGKDALEYLHETIISPDYIFLDINLPEMDGRELLKVIKMTAGLKSIPVIMYSTSTYPADKKLCLQLGAAGFITKPNSFSGMCEVLKEFLGQ
jgi:CheY-like chemotaxis protein